MVTMVTCVACTVHVQVTVGGIEKFPFRCRSVSMQRYLPFPFRCRTVSVSHLDRS